MMCYSTSYKVFLFNLTITVNQKIKTLLDPTIENNNLRNKKKKRELERSIEKM